jgi:hypothetical protein
MPDQAGVVAFDERGEVSRVEAGGRPASLGNVGGRALQVLPAAHGWQVLTAEALYFVPNGA